MLEASCDERALQRCNECPEKAEGTHRHSLGVLGRTWVGLCLVGSPDGWMVLRAFKGSTLQHVAHWSICDSRTERIMWACEGPTAIPVRDRALGRDDTWQPRAPLAAMFRSEGGHL